MVSQNSKAIFEAALQLSIEDRMQLMKELRQSVKSDSQDSVDSAFEIEIERRIEAARRDSGRLINGESILTKLEAGQKP